MGEPAIRAALQAGARNMGHAVEWQHLAQGVAAFLRSRAADYADTGPSTHPVQVAIMAWLTATAAAAEEAARDG